MERQIIYQSILDGSWDYQWQTQACQRFVATDRAAFTFCAKPTLHDSYFCKQCSGLVCAQKLVALFRDSEMTQDDYFEDRKKFAREMALARLPKSTVMGIECE